MQTAELVMTQPSRQMMEPAEVPAGIKTILVRIHDDEGLENVLQIALSLGRAFGAHLHLLHVTAIEAYTVTDAFGTFVNAEIVQVLEEEAGNLKTRIERQLTGEDVAWDYEEVTGTLIPHLIQDAALADLVVVSRQPFERGFSTPAITLLGDLIHRSRTPLLVVGDGTDDVDPFGAVTVAWNGSYESANALRLAVPLLKLASRVRLVTVDEPKEGQFPSTTALEYLSRHGVHAELHQRGRFMDTIEQEILDEAAKDGASYIVMGGYSHSRAGEFLFGGVTRSLLKKSPVPLFVAH